MRRRLICAQLTLYNKVAEMQEKLVRLTHTHEEDVMHLKKEHMHEVRWSDSSQPQTAAESVW